MIGRVVMAVWAAALLMGSAKAQSVEGDLDPRNHARVETTGVEGTAWRCDPRHFPQDIDWLNGDVDIDPERQHDFAVVIADQVPVYPAPNAPLPERQRLRFSELVRVLAAAPGGGWSGTDWRLRVADLNEVILGWVDVDALMCRTRALSSGGQERLLFIKASIADSVEASNAPPPGVTIYQSPISNTCPLRECQRFASTQPLFVYAESSGRYLIAPTREIGLSRSLVGWVDKDVTLPWETGLALRPRPSPADDGGQGDREALTGACAFPSREAALAYQPSEPLRGCLLTLPQDYRWFASRFRLPVLGDYHETQDLQTEAASPTVVPVGLPVVRPSEDGGSDLDERGLVFDISSGREPKPIEAYKNIVVMFVLDGTGSMAQAIGALTGEGRESGIVQWIASQLETRLQQLGGEVFLGFQVFGDTSQNPDNPYGTSGLGASHPPPGEQWRCPKNGAEENNAAFDAALREIRPQGVVRDGPRLEDFAENTWGGMAEAARRMHSCQPGATRIIIVIGDHGYNAERQEDRGFEAVTLRQLVHEIDRREENDPLPLLYFIQAPWAYQEGVEGDYRDAYSNFVVQAKSILDRLYLGSDHRDHQQENLFLLSSDEMAHGIEKISDQVIDRIIDHFTSLNMNHERDDVTIPVLKLQDSHAFGLNDAIFFVPMANDDDASAHKWHEEDIEGVSRLYANLDDSWVAEMLMWPEDFVLWERVLIRFELDIDREQARARLVAGLVRTLESRLQLQVQSTDEQIGDFVQRAGYFVGRVKTPLMRYTFSELLDPELVPACEVEHLQDYARHVARILSILRLGDRRPLIETGPHPAVCDFSEKGLGVPNIVAVDEGPWDRDDESSTASRTIIYEARGELFYWVPVEYLP